MTSVCGGCQEKIRGMSKYEARKLYAVLIVSANNAVLTYCAFLDMLVIKHFHEGVFFFYDKYRISSTDINTVQIVQKCMISCCNIPVVWFPHILWSTISKLRSMQIKIPEIQVTYKQNL